MKHHQAICFQKTVKKRVLQKHVKDKTIKPVMMHLTKDVINEVYNFYIDQWKSGEYP